MGNLSDAQFAELAKQKGASRRSVDNTEPSSGYMVGGKPKPDGSSFEGNDYAVPLSEFSVQHVADHMAAVKESYPDDPAVYQGAWQEDANVVFDASENVHGRAKARLEGIKRKERAVYDVARNEDVALPQRAVH